jgi:histidinol-phosphate phosphatase family protein
MIKNPISSYFADQNSDDKTKGSTHSTPRKSNENTNESLQNKRKADKKKPAAFLDRDGLIIEFVPKLVNVADVKLREGVSTAIASLNQMGYWVFVVTNQPHIASQELTRTQLDLIHSHMSTLLMCQQAKIDKIYYCPHTSKDNCLCRKPLTGMLEQASKDFPIEHQDSFMIGDTWRDVDCARNFSLKAYAVSGGNGYPYDETVNIIADSKPPKVIPQPDMLFTGLPDLLKHLKKFSC